MLTSPARDLKEGVKIPVITMDDIVNRQAKKDKCVAGQFVHSQAIVLKMDCEGCEYESMMSASNDVFKSFSHIQIEYHHGYKNLDKLERCGFKVSFGGPLARRSSNPYLRFIYATRKKW